MFWNMKITDALEELFKVCFLKEEMKVYRIYNDLVLTELINVWNIPF